jgi:hypothetical protein
MKETYTRQEAMKRLGLKTSSAFLRVEKRYHEAFIVVQGVAKGQVRYDRVLLDQFAGWRERFKMDNHEHSKG